MPRFPPPTAEPDMVWFGGHPDRATICLRVCGDSLDPEEITRILRRPPTRSQRRGKPVLSESGETKRIARTGSWSLDWPVNAEDTLEEAIESLLNGLPEDEKVWASLNEQYHVDLFCDLFVRGVNQGLVLSPRVLARIGRLGVTLVIDIFCESDEVQRAKLEERLG